MFKLFGVGCTGQAFDIYVNLRGDKLYSGVRIVYIDPAK